jgi:hypothetical protein
MPLRQRLAERRAAKAGGAPQDQAPPEQAQDQAPPEPAPAQATSSTDDQLSELKQLGELHDQGVLTDEEFEAKKKEVLDAL